MIKKINSLLWPFLYVDTQAFARVCGVLPSVMVQTERTEDKL